MCRWPVGIYFPHDRHIFLIRLFIMLWIEICISQRRTQADNNSGRAISICLLGHIRLARDEDIDRQSLIKDAHRQKQNADTF